MISGGNPQPFTPVDQSRSFPTADLHAQITADSASVSGASLGRSGLIDALAVMMYVGAPNPSTATGYLDLAPNTELRITAQAQYSASVDLSCAGCEQDCVGVSASAYLGACSTRSFDRAGKNTTLHGYGSNPVDSLSDSGELTVTLTNSESTVTRQGLQLSASASIRYYPVGAPIPEPGTYALVGICLAAAGWRARRRKAPRA